MSIKNDFEEYRGKPQIPYEIYFQDGYKIPRRLDEHREQIRQVIKCNPSSVLEIGIGNKWVYNRLKKQIELVVGCDFDGNLKPDVIGNVMSLPFDDNSFDIILCAEVLEHLPFHMSMNAFREIKRVSKKFIILTLPQQTLDNRFFRTLKSKPFIFKGEHFWELGSGFCTLKSIEQMFDQEEMKLLDCFGLNVYRLHRFKWLTKSLYKINPKSKWLKFNGSPVFFVLKKKGT